MAVLIELRGVNFCYEQGGMEQGVRDIGLTIAAGEVVVLCGESGCGKSTLLRLINGLIPRYFAGRLSGRILIDGKPIAEQPLYEIGKTVGSVFQNPRTQFFHTDIRSELVFGLENQGWSREECEDRLQELIREFALQPLLNRTLLQLSDGERQIVACAVAAAGRPSVLAMDEPSANLDQASVDKLTRIIASWKAAGNTIVIAEHRLHYLRDLADRFLFMKDGRILRELPRREMQSLAAAELSKMGLRPLQPTVLRLEDKNSFRIENNWRFSSFRLAGVDGSALELLTKEFVASRGSVIGITGPNGSGKTMLARCLCGLEKKCRGKVTRGDAVFRPRDLLPYCYMVMQDVNRQLFAENVLAEVFLSQEKMDAAAASEIMEMLDLGTLGEEHPLFLSGGQKQRVAIAAAAAAEREIIILDEPTSGLDWRHMRKVATLIARMSESGKTIFVVSHDLEFIQESCTQVVTMDQGCMTGWYSLALQEHCAGN